MKTLVGKGWRIAVCALFGVMLFVGGPINSTAAQTTGVVSARSAKVRKEASTSSDVVAGVIQGSVVTIIEEVKDNAGTTWYKVNVDNKTGYIRSDLLTKSTGGTGSAGTSQPAASASTPIAPTKAYVNYESVRVRKGASTSHDTLGSISENTAVMIVGEARGSDGRQWYEIEYTNQSGRTAKGFVRADLVTVGDPPTASTDTPAEPTEPEEPQAEVPEENADPAGEGEGQTIGDGNAATEPSAEAERPDYEMVFTENPEGVKEWYLYDNTNNTRQTLSGLLAAANAGVQQDGKDEGESSKQGILIIALAVALIICIIGITLLLFKIKDMQYQDYGDYEDEDDLEEEEEEPVYESRKRLKRGKSSEPALFTVEEPIKLRNEKSSRKAENEMYHPEEEAFEPGKPAVEKPLPKRKAKNFLAEDDEFEFEFLNMDD